MPYARNSYKSDPVLRGLVENDPPPIPQYVGAEYTKPMMQDYQPYQQQSGDAQQLRSLMDFVRERQAMNRHRSTVDSGGQKAFQPMMQ